MFKVMISQWFNDYEDIFTGEYSGIEHSTIEAANEELVEAKLHEVDNEVLYSLFVKETCNV